MRKRALVVGPVMPQSAEREVLLKSLEFYTAHQSLEFIDPLDFFETQDDDAYYARWREYIKERLSDFDSFVGFSFGGVILQQCFEILSTLKKPIFLFSTPSYADDALKTKLEDVATLSESGAVEQALIALQKHVVFPKKLNVTEVKIADTFNTARRTVLGLRRVLRTDSRNILRKVHVEHVHFVGEHSDLVNTSNVVEGRGGKTVIVPGSGMRMLQDNPEFCKKIIVEHLQHEH